MISFSSQNPINQAFLRQKVILKYMQYTEQWRNEMLEFSYELEQTALNMV